MIGRPLLRQRRKLWFYLFAALALALVVLALYNGVLFVIARLERVPVPQPGELLYISTFDAYNTQWSQFQGQMSAQIEGGVLRFAIDDVNNGVYSVLDQTLSDFDVSADMRWLKLPGDSGQVGLLFRYQDLTNYYVFKLRADGAYRVEQVKDSTPETISEWQISPHVRTGENSMNTMRVIGRGNTFAVSVNGEALPLCLKGSDRKSTWTRRDSGKCLSNNQQTSPAFSDDSFTTGKIALGAASDVDVPGLQVAFDNVIVLGPMPITESMP